MALPSKGIFKLFELGQKIETLKRFMNQISDKKSYWFSYNFWFHFDLDFLRITIK